MHQLRGRIRFGQGLVALALAVVLLTGALLISTMRGGGGLLQAQTTGPTYQLDAETLDVAVHELGSHWAGDVAQGPLLVDFGGSGANAPVAGLGQWLTANGYGPAQPDADVLGAQRVVVLRTRFNDYGNTTRFTRAEVEGFFDELNTLWKNTSYGKISIDYQVTDLFALPDDRTDYVDDLPPCEPDPAIRPNGDLSCDGKFDKVLSDAIANSPNTLDWTNIDAVMVVMSETDNSQFHRGQGSGSCNLRMGPGGSVKNVGCAIFSENPTETERQVWGRWAHEIGHAFQQAGPAHPSNYRSEFELMDSNYPGQTGVFEKQATQAFPGWMPDSKYVRINKDNGGETICLWAMEYDPTGKPVPQAIRADITGSLYYLVSVRRRVLGDELNGGFANGIPDEGVLIERVVEGADQWVTVQGKGGDRDQLWKEGDTFNGGTDGVQILIGKQVDEDNYCVTVRFNKAADQPDVMLDPWTSPPGNTWETTDIWVDSPVNGFGTFRYGQWNDLDGNLVPRGNGDDPAVGMVNRLYARVRNRGTVDATNVKVHFEITDPPGLGIAGANGWANLGSVDKNTFAGLAAIPPGGYVDVYLEWTPNFALTPQQIADGTFYFHTCVRVKLDPVAGETVLGNQDGDREQENINYFQAIPPSEGGSVLDQVITLRNPDLVNPKWFSISYESDIPDGWILQVNEGRTGVEVPPGDTVEIPVFIKPQGPAVVGSIFGVDVSASSLELLINDKDPKDRHPGYDTLGGARVEARVMVPPKVTCSALDQGPNEIFVEGELAGAEKFYNEKEPFTVFIIGVDGARNFISATGQVLTVDRNGKFSGYLAPSRTKTNPGEVVCIFAGTQELASASSGYVPVASGGSGQPTPTRTPVPTWTPVPTNSPTPGPTNTPTPALLLLPWNPPVGIIQDPPQFAAYDLGIFGIEVTQGIQCFDTSQGLATCPDNSMPLVTDKSTTARVYLQYESSLFNHRANTPVTLYLRKDGGAWQTVTTTAKALKNLDQSDADNSANFFFTITGSSSVLVDMYAVVDATGNLTEWNEDNNRYPSSGYLTLTFRPRTDLSIKGSRLRWDPAGADGPWTAGDGAGSGTSGWTVNAGSSLWLNQLLPLGDGDITYGVNSGYRNWTGSLNGDDQHALIETMNGEYTLALIFTLLFGGTPDDLVDHFYGWIPNNRGSFGHADMPIYPHAGGLGVVAIGTDDPGTSTDNPGPGALIFGHEIVHDYDVFHTNTGADDCGSNDSSSDFPYATSSIQEFGFNPITSKVYNPANTHDLMSYCPSGGSKEGWIAPFTWNKMFNSLDGTTVAAADAQAPYGPNAVVAQGPNGVGTIFRTTAQQSLVVAATVFNPDNNSGKSSGQLNTMHLVDDGYDTDLPQGDYKIQLRQGNQVLAERAFVVNFESEYHAAGDQHGSGPHATDPQTGEPLISAEDPIFDPDPTAQVGVSMVIPWVEGADNVALVFGETVLDQRAVTTNAPTVAVTDPAGPEAWKAGTSETLAWKGDDQDEDTLTYSVFYSYDGGQTWQLLIANLTEPGLTLDVDSLAGGSDVRFRVVATDGINVGLAETEFLITVPNKAPQVVIMEPVDRIVVTPDDLVVFQGGATDLEDGTIDGADLHWQSDVQGSLGVGNSLAFNQLTPGAHVITLSAADQYGVQGTASVNVFVGYQVDLPLVVR